jgi:hypothetical protein
MGAMLRKITYWHRMCLDNRGILFYKPLWGFKVEKVGQTEIKMDYHRKWEGVEKSTDHFFIAINMIKKRR